MRNIVLRYKCIPQWLPPKDLAKEHNYQSNILKRKNRHRFCNISHSNQLVVSASSDTPIGVDIEYHKQISIKDLYPDVFPADIWEVILSKEGEEMQQLFYDYWTKLESVLKADGRGFSLPLEFLVWNVHQDYILTERNLWITTNYNFFSKYSCAIAELATGSLPRNIVIEHE